MVEEQERILKRINVPGECNYRVDGLCKHSMGTPYHVGERCNAGWTDFPDWCPLELAPPNTTVKCPYCGKKYFAPDNLSEEKKETKDE